MDLKYSTERKRKNGMHNTVALGKSNIYANKTMIYFTRTNKKYRPVVAGGGGSSRCYAQ